MQPSNRFVIKTWCEAILKNGTSGTLALLGEKYNPGDAEGLEKELAKSLSHMIVVRLDVEHMTGKEAIELVRMRQKR